MLCLCKIIILILIKKIKVLTVFIVFFKVKIFFKVVFQKINTKRPQNLNFAVFYFSSRLCVKESLLENYLFLVKLLLLFGFLL